MKAEESALSSQNRTYSPLSGATLFVSGKSDTESNYIPALNKTSVVTDADGNYTYSFYGEGRYNIAFQDLRENNYQNKELYGLTAGDIVKVHVLPSDNSDSLKKEILDELDKVYKEYDESYFIETEWATLTGIYGEAVNAINAETDLYKAGNLLNAAVGEIKAVQSEMLKANTTRLTDFRKVLSRLPSDVSLLGKSGEFLAQELVRIYGTMSRYQISLLTAAETELYKEIETAYNAGLPELEPFEFNLEIIADTPEAKAAIEDMLVYILNNSQHAYVDLFSGSVFERNIYCNSNIESRKRFSLADNTLKSLHLRYIRPRSVATGIGPYVHF